MIALPQIAHFVKKFLQWLAAQSNIGLVTIYTIYMNENEGRFSYMYEFVCHQRPMPFTLTFGA